jgi:hypothetical protein
MENAPGTVVRGAFLLALPIVALSNPIVRDISRRDAAA